MSRDKSALVTTWTISKKVTTEFGFKKVSEMEVKIVVDPEGATVTTTTSGEDLQPLVELVEMARAGNLWGAISKLTTMATTAAKSNPETTTVSD